MAVETNFAVAAARLRVADRELIRLARRNIRDAVAPVKDAIRVRALETLPKSGGLAARVAGSRLGTSTSFSPRTGGVTLRMRSQDNLRSIDAGRVRHPLFGDRKHWYEEAVTPGFFSGPVADATREVEAACMAALEEAAEIGGFH